MVGSTIARPAMLAASLVLALWPVAPKDARAGIDDGIEAAKNGEYMDAVKEIVSPVRESLENGVCDVVVTVMPGVERGIGSVEALLADVYYYGHFVPADYNTAVKWYLRAGDKGNALAQSTLGDIFYYGRGVPQDYRTAAKWWERAAEQGVAVAQLNLSVLYANGEGVEKNLVRSHMYANLAAARLPLGKDYEIAVKNREYIASQMTPEQIAEAQRQAKAWKSLAERKAERDGVAAQAEAGEDGVPRRCRW